ncbi:hypothetical protein FACS1894166_11430 [Bacilli bacterium]|nr:hypothetical protein FACS1894166_11430 [Bacilli bacterium]
MVFPKLIFLHIQLSKTLELNLQPAPIVFPYKFKVLYLASKDGVATTVSLKPITGEVPIVPFHFNKLSGTGTVADVFITDKKWVAIGIGVGAISIVQPIFKSSKSV